MKDAADSSDAVPQQRVPCEVYSRIVGYLRPVQDWNKGKQQEFAERRTYAPPVEGEKGQAEVSVITCETEGNVEVSAGRH
jgi:hypothetical protein